MAMLLEEPLDAVEDVIEDLDIRKIDQTDMPFAQFWRKATSVDQQDVFFVKKLQHEIFVIRSPFWIRESNEHVEGATGLFNLQTFNFRDAFKAMVSLLHHALSVAVHPRPVALETGKVAHLSRR